VAIACSGKADLPWQAPAIAPAIAAIVSLSPPREAASRHARQGSSGTADSTPNAAGTDSMVARLVPIRVTR
jgi:hypothetical protein